VACRQAAWMEQNARDIRDALKHIAAVDAERAAAAFSNAKSSARCSRRRMPRRRRWSDGGRQRQTSPRAYRARV
jgi:hypothetical protein